MDHLHATLRKAAQDVRLDPRVRDGFRRTLVLMAAGPAPAPSFRLPRAFAWALGAFVIATSGATVTLASARALPGETLYAAKVQVLEPVERAFAFSAEAEGEVAVRHLERRFREAAELSASGRYAAHDAELAALAEADVRVLDDERHAASRARFEALAAAYGPTLALDASGRVAFRNATRLGRIGDDELPDEVASAAARSQLALAKENRESASSSGAVRTKAAERRIEESKRLAAAAEAELGKGSYRAALELSGASAKAATEARLFAAIASSTSATSTASSTQATSSAATSTTQASTTKASATASSSPAASGTTPSSPGKGPQFLDGLFR